VAAKCTNKGSASNDKLDEFSGTYIFEDNGSGSRSVEKEKSHALAFHGDGAMLLQSALVKKFAETNDEDGPRKRMPVSDIGNTLVCLIKLEYHSSLISSLQIQCCWAPFCYLIIIMIYFSCSFRLQKFACFIHRNL
jgi:hypothetical protein